MPNATAVWTGRVMSGLLAAFLAFSAGIKLIHRPEVAETLVPLGWPADAGFALGVLEATVLVLYLIPRTAVLGAILMTGLLGGAMATHVRVGSPLFSHILFGLYMGLFAWGGLWLRDARLRALFPWRKS
ncbi:MAG: DoxX family protein [Steroidobacteraceae bacterium]